MNTSQPIPTAYTASPNGHHLNPARFATLDNPPTSVATRRFSVAAGVLWFGVAASSRAWWWDSVENWQLWYGLYALLLGSAALLTAAATISAAARASSDSTDPGVAITLFAVCTTIIGFAVPLWTVAIAVGYGVFAIVAPEHRRALVMLAVAQLAGLAVLLAGEAAELGPTDNAGDLPLPTSAALATIALLTANGLVMLNRGAQQPTPEPDDTQWMSPTDLITAPDN